MKKIIYGSKKLFVIIFALIFIVNGLFGTKVMAAISNQANSASQTPSLNLRTISITDTSVTLAWELLSSKYKVINYEIYMNDILIGSTSKSTYLKTGLAPSTTYQFFVRAKLKANNTAISNTLNVTTVVGVPTPTPTIKPTVTPTPSPVPTVTPTPTSSPTPTATPLPTPTSSPVPTVTPVLTPTPSPVPTVTSIPTPTPSPTPTATPTPTPIVTSTNKMIGYYAAWAAYSGFTPDKIDANKLTHINYAFANIGSDYKITLGYPDVDTANIAKLNSLKLINPALKTLIAVGGWSWSGRFSDVALTEQSRTIFADSCVDFLVRYGFDGIDIDWEYPVSGGLSTNIRRPEDKQNFTLLMQKLREKLDARGAIDGKEYLLSFAGAAGSWYINNIELNKIEKYVDYANVMTYDIHGSWEPYTDFNAPLYNSSESSPQYKWSVDSSIKAWLSTGFPANKLVMGIPFYGYLYKAVSNVNNGLYQTYSGSSSISYENIVVNYLKAPGYVRYFHEESMVPWLFNGSTFISYEDEQSIKYKAEYIKNQGLGGAMIWELSQDPNRVLLNALYDGLK